MRSEQKCNRVLLVYWVTLAGRVFKGDERPPHGPPSEACLVGEGTHCVVSLQQPFPGALSPRGAQNGGRWAGGGVPRRLFKSKRDMFVREAGRLLSRQG